MKRLVRADPQALQPRRSLRGFVEAANYAVVSEAPQLAAATPEGLPILAVE
jgi:hypothetical protein